MISYTGRRLKIVVYALVCITAVAVVNLLASGLYIYGEVSHGVVRYNLENTSSVSISIHSVTRSEFSSALTSGKYMSVKQTRSLATTLTTTTTTTTTTVQNTGSKMSSVHDHHRNGNSKGTEPDGTQSQRPDSCTGCLPHDFAYLIQNEAVCRPMKQEQIVDLIVLIFTIHSHSKHRDNIRSTWMSVAKNNTSNVRYVFLLGRSVSDDLNKAVKRESEIHGDIIMEDFKETYNNLTLKTMMGMKWANSFCNKARFVFKTDDDMWVNMPSLIKVLNDKEKSLQNTVSGQCWTIGAPHRDPRSKWFASVKSYPHKQYPGFCSGTGYVTSMHVAQKIYEISPSVPFFHLEDVYIALCIKRLGFRLENIPGFYNQQVTKDPCKMKSSKILTVHEIPTDYLQKVWNTKC